MCRLQKALIGALQTPQTTFVAGVYKRPFKRRLQAEAREPLEAPLFHVGLEQVPDNRAHPEGRRVGWSEFRALMETDPHDALVEVVLAIAIAAPLTTNQRGLGDVLDRAGGPVDTSCYHLWNLSGLLRSNGCFCVSAGIRKSATHANLTWCSTRT